jgi:uncharacterized protein (TIGR03905 family)
MYSYKTKGTCSKEITFDLEDGRLKNVRFKNGCNGNLQGIGRLTENMDAEAIMNKLSGIRCGDKETSCPDQLSKAIKQALKK